MIDWVSDLCVLTSKNCFKDVVLGKIAPRLELDSIEFTLTSSCQVIPSMTAPAGAAAEEAAAKTGEAAAGAASTGIAAADTATSAVGTAASKTGEAVTGVASTGIAAVDTATSAAETAAAKTGGVAAGVASASREVPIATPIILPAPAKSKPAAVVDDSEAPGPAKSLPLGPANSLAQSPANSLAQGPAKSYIAQSPSGMNSNTLWAVLGGVAVAAALGGVAAFASSSSESKKGGKRGLKISAQDEESATSIAPSPLHPGFTECETCWFTPPISVYN